MYVFPSHHFPFLYFLTYVTSLALSPTSHFCVLPATADSNQLPTLYFAVLMGGHMLDHFVFTARRLSERTKSIVFALVACAIVGNFWWFRGVAWGIDGPINDHWGLGWRKVCYFFPFWGTG